MAKAKLCGCKKTEFAHKYDPVHYLVRNVDELREALARDIHEFAIALNGGVKSCKYITTYKDKRGVEKFSVLNMIDDSRQTFTAKTILDESKTNIGKAMKSNALFVDEEVGEVIDEKECEHPYRDASDRRYCVDCGKKLDRADCGNCGRPATHSAGGINRCDRCVDL